MSGRDIELIRVNMELTNRDTLMTSAADLASPCESPKRFSDRHPLQPILTATIL